MSTLQELFTEYDQADARWETKKQELEQATRVRSNVVKAIAESIAPKKKILRAGRELTIVARPSGDGVITYFFRGNSKSADVVEVE